jgi:phosphoglycerate dehydrogenase-like enzyme
MSFKFVMLPPQTDVYRDWGARLSREVPGLDVVLAETAEEAARAIVDAEGAAGALPPDLLSKATRIRWLQSYFAAPPAGFYYDDLVAHPLTVTNMREIFNDHLGAHIMAFVLAFARGFHHYFRRQVRREWAPHPTDTGVVHLAEATALIVGLGGIGSEVARLASAFGMRVVATDARRTALTPGVSELYPPDRLDELLPRADFVILTVPHTPTTEGFITRARLRRMKPTAFFINIGRGKTTRLGDLVASLQAGEIGGAGLDVFEEEPLPPDHPLWSMPNVLITPHVGGYGPYLDERRYQIIRDNSRAIIAGAALRNVVDKQAWF